MRSEFEFIDHIKKTYGLSRIGDDCAVLPKDAETELVITADMLVEDVDFKLKWTSPKFIGHKALAVSLSDIAAMGAVPKWAILSLGVPKEQWKNRFVDEFYEGFMSLAERFGVELVGGDVSQVPGKIVLDSVVGGEVTRGGAVLRSGAKPGDKIYVTGRLGGAAGGLRLLKNGVRYGEQASVAENELILRQLTPWPRIDDGRILGEAGVSAMIDISDGLS
ncbi:MAG: thiamine-phosphate kinase, partial [Pyrinomonadaceae bacterium]|nr:thiamine-phosphate kinase [Pyrinomonadaceae bacterium]